MHLQYPSFHFHPHILSLSFTRSLAPVIKRAVPFSKPSEYPVALIATRLPTTTMNLSNTMQIIRNASIFNPLYWMILQTWLSFLSDSSSDTTPANGLLEYALNSTLKSESVILKIVSFNRTNGHSCFRRVC